MVSRYAPVVGYRGGLYNLNGDVEDAFLLPPLAAEFGEGSFRQVNVGAPPCSSIPDRHADTLTAP